MSGLVHLGLIYESSDELADAVVPHVRAALDLGQTVYAAVDDGVEARMRDRIGPAAGWIRFLPHSTMFGLSPPDSLRRLGTLAGTGRRSVVVGQYSRLVADPDDCAVTEDGVNLVLADLPLTLVCACSPADGADLVTTARRAHPGWIADRATHPNPDFHPPVDRCPTPPETWGRPVLRTTFRGLADLARVRNQVIELVCEMGLRGADIDAAVLAVHEAAVLACPDRDGCGAGVPEAARCMVEVRTVDTTLFGEVRGPWPPGPPVTVDTLACPGAEPLRPLSWFCDRATVDDHFGTRTVRVLVGRSGAPRASRM